jgi:hypothetical protein
MEMTEAARRGREYWQPLVEELEKSGLRHAEFAAQRGIELGSLRSWLYRLRQEQRAGQGTGDGEVRMVPIRLGTASSPAVEIVVGRCTVRMGPQADPAAVAALVAALEARC